MYWYWFFGASIGVCFGGFWGAHVRHGGSLAHENTAILVSGITGSIAGMFAGWIISSGSDGRKITVSAQDIPGILTSGLAGGSSAIFIDVFLHETNLHFIVIGFIELASFFVLLLVGKKMSSFTMLITEMVSFITTRGITLWQFRTIICGECLRYTHPLQSKYDNGVRYCEHCQKDVKRTKEIGKVFFSFGMIPLAYGGRIFLRSNPDTQLLDQPIDLSEVIIDTATCDPLNLESFITYIINHPPQKGIKSVKIFYRGNLEELGAPLKNALYNTFASVTPKP